MDEPLETFLTDHEEIITAREARSARIRTEQIRAAIDAGDLVRVAGRIPPSFGPADRQV